MHGAGPGYAELCAAAASDRIAIFLDCHFLDCHLRAEFDDAVGRDGEEFRRIDRLLG